MGTREERGEMTETERISIGNKKAVIQKTYLCT